MESVRSFVGNIQHRPMHAATAVLHYPDGDTECAAIADALRHALEGALRTLPNIRVVQSSNEVDVDAVLPHNIVVDLQVRRSADRVRISMRGAAAKTHLDESKAYLTRACA